MEPHRFLFDLFAMTVRSPPWETVSIIFRAGARWNRTDFCSICSPSQLVDQHGKPYRLFFERELDGTAPISVRSVRLHNSLNCMGNRIDYFSSGSSMEPHRFLHERSSPSVSLTAERLFHLQGTHVIPILFWSQTHNRCSPSWDPHRLFSRPGARTESHKGDICHPFFYIYRRASACC